MRKIIPAVVAGTAVLVTAAATFGYVTLDKDVQLSVDGVNDHVDTLAGTVGDVLQSKGIELGEHDVVAPGPDTKLADGTTIAVQYGRQIRVTVDGQQQSYWTTATRVGEALASLDIESEGADLSTSRSTPIGREGLSFNLATQKTITIDNAGKTERVTTTAQTVGAALSAAKIDLDDDDQLSISEDTALTNGSSFTVTKVDVKTVTKQQRVKYPTRYSDDAQLEKGKTKVKTEGKPGVQEVVITEVRHNGKLQSRKEKATLATPPRTEVVLRGTKEPEPEPNTSDETANDTANNDAADDDTANDDTANDADDNTDAADSDNTADDADDTGVADAVWDKVAQCESGQNWSINTGNGYFGGLQFARRSWTAYGGTEYAELASEATREQQIVIAKKILDDVGWKAWPACSRKLGLR